MWIEEICHPNRTPPIILRPSSATTLLALDIRLPANLQIASEAGLLKALNDLGQRS